MIGTDGRLRFPGDITGSRMGKLKDSNDAGTETEAEHVPC